MGGAVLSAAKVTAWAWASRLRAIEAEFSQLGEQAGPALFGLIGKRVLLAVAGPACFVQQSGCEFGPVGVSGAIASGRTVSGAASGRTARLHAQQAGAQRAGQVAVRLLKQPGEGDFGRAALAAEFAIEPGERELVGGGRSEEAGGEQPGQLRRGERAVKPAQQEQGGSDDG